MDVCEIWDMTVALSIPCEIDKKAVREALGVLLDPKGAHEIRGLKGSNGKLFVRSRMVRSSDLETAVKAVEELSDSNGVYFTLNPVRPTLGDYAAKTGDILSRRHFLVDIDRAKVKGDESMATDQEKEQVFELANRVGDWLLSEGWPAPIMIDSGNGAHLTYRIDLPNDELSRAILSRAIKALAQRFNTVQATIDVKVIDAPRISKLPGTWVRKGTNTPERPWRIARLLYAPPKEQIVTIEQIEALTHQGTVHADEPACTPSPWEMVYESPPDKVASYVQSGINRELAKIVLSNPGNRNNALNEAAFAIGQLVGGKFISRSEAERKLTDAASRTGLSDFEIDRTIESAINAGEQQPRILPVTVMGGQRNGVHPKPAMPTGRKLVRYASDVKPRKVEWLWPNRIPLGKMTTFAGQGGLGKTFVLLDIAARISTGAEWPFAGGECAEPGKVLIISGEDDEEDTLVPRLIELGADLTKIAFLSTDAHDHFSMAALQLLTDVIHIMGDVRMVAIDPPTSYLGGVDDHKNSELRALLTPLKKWCADHRNAIVMNNHVNKNMGPGIDSASRVMGSVAWVNAVRAAHMFAKDKNEKGRVLFVPIKINVARMPKGIAYAIEGQPSGEAKVKWIEEIDQTADEAVEQAKQKPRVVQAREVLVEMFLKQKQWASEDFWLSCRQNGVSVNAVKDFKSIEKWPKCSKSIDPDGKPVWVWSVRQDFDGDSVTR